MGSVSKPIKSPAGRRLSVGDLKSGKLYEFDVATGKLVPPKKPKKSRPK